MSEYNVEDTIQQISKLNFKGNIIPHSWFGKICFDSGKPDLLAMMILAEIVYWYRPETIKDESTGQIIGLKKKFKADMLQRSVGSFADQFGMSKRQIMDALKRLQTAGLIIKECREIDTGLGKLTNVLFVAPVVGVIANLDDDLPLMQSNVPPLCNQLHKGMQSNVPGDVIKRSTYTENTTKSTTENTTKETAALEGHTQGGDLRSTSDLKNAAAVSLSSLTFEANIGKTISPSQKAEIARKLKYVSKVVPLVDLGKTQSDVEKTVLDTHCFSMCGNDFARKLNTVVKAYREGKWMGYLQKKGSAQESPLTPEESQLKALNSELNHVKAEIQSLNLGKQGVMGQDPVFVRSLDESIARMRVKASAVREKICKLDATEVSLAC